MLPARFLPPITIEAQPPTAQGKRRVTTSLFEDFSTHLGIGGGGAAWLCAARYPRLTWLHRKPAACQMLSNWALDWDESTDVPSQRHTVLLLLSN